MILALNMNASANLPKELPCVRMKLLYHVHLYTTHKELLYDVRMKHNGGGTTRTFEYLNK